MRLTNVSKPVTREGLGTATVYQHPPISAEWPAPRPSRELQMTAPTAPWSESYYVSHLVSQSR